MGNTCDDDDDSFSKKNERVPTSTSTTTGWDSSSFLAVVYDDGLEGVQKQPKWPPRPFLLIGEQFIRAETYKY